MSKRKAMRETWHRWLGGGAALVLAATLVSCGGGDGVSCGMFTPCGGDVTGLWKIGGLCPPGVVDQATGDDDPFDGQCPGAMVRSNASYGGQVIFNPDGTYSSALMLGGSVSMTIPTACFAEGGFTPTCADLNAQLAQLTQGQDSPFASGSCSGSGVCSCTFVLRPETENETGTYTVAGTQLTLMSSGGAQETDQYCVQGNQLRVGSSSEFVVLQK